VSIISQLQSIWNSLDFSRVLGILAALLPTLLCITVHELSHGLAALALGDDTAKRSGRLSLNPMKHLDVMGLLMMLCFRVGWAKPVPVDMSRFQKPKTGMALTALAGPASNVLLAALFLFLFGLLYLPVGGSTAGDWLLQMLQLGAYMSLGLGLFNLLPVPPLDGSKILFSCLNEQQYAWLMRYERYGGIVMLLLVASGALGKPLSAAISWLFNVLTVFVELGFRLALFFV